RSSDLRVVDDFVLLAGGLYVGGRDDFVTAVVGDDVRFAVRADAAVLDAERVPQGLANVAVVPVAPGLQAGAERVRRIVDRTVRATDDLRLDGVDQADEVVLRGPEEQPR